MSDQLFQAVNVVQLLSLGVGPELLNVRMPVRIGVVLVVPPQRIQPSAQFMDQIVIVVSSTGGFPNMGEFFFGGESHAGSPSGKQIEVGSPVLSLPL